MANWLMFNKHVPKILIKLQKHCFEGIWNQTLNVWNFLYEAIENFLKITKSFCLQHLAHLFIGKWQRQKNKIFFYSSFALHNFSLTFDTLKKQSVLLFVSFGLVVVALRLSSILLYHDHFFNVYVWFPNIHFLHPTNISMLA